MSAQHTPEERDEMAWNEARAVIARRNKDARIRDAAPELLEALQGAAVAIKYAVAAADSEADYVRLCKIQNAVTAAIAKATGGAA